MLLTAGFVAAGLLAARAADRTEVGGAPSELDLFGYPTNVAKATELGRSDARHDLSNGVVRLPMYGLPGEWTAEYNHILETKHHIGRLGLGGCLVSAGLLAYADGYSGVSQTWIEQKFGTNIFNQANQEAQAVYQARIEAMGRKQAQATDIHTIQVGDTLSKIAKQHGVTVKAVAEANPGVDATRLKVGQKLTLPSK